MATILSFSRWLKPREKTLSFKHYHFLNSLPQDRLEEILLFSEGDHLNFLWPEFKNKKVLFLNDQKHKYTFRKILTDQPQTLVNYVFKGFDSTKDKEDYLTVLGELEKPAIRRGYFDIVICPMALENTARISVAIRALAPLLDNGARLVLSVRHPNLDNILFNQSPAAPEVMETTLSKFYHLLKENHLFTEDIREGTVDLPLKAFFCDGETDYYHEYKNTPLTLMIRAVKFQRKQTGQTL